MKLGDPLGPNLPNTRPLGATLRDGLYDIFGGILTTSGCFCKWLDSRINVPKIFIVKTVSPANSRIAESGSTDHAHVA
jgi:hypothetical protein